MSTTPAPVAPTTSATPAATPVTPTATATPNSGNATPGTAPRNGGTGATPSGKSPMAAAKTEPMVHDGADGSAPKPADHVAETPAERKAREIAFKVRGREAKVDVNALSDAELAKRLQFAEAGRLAMQEAAETRKQVDRFFEQFRKDPLSVLQDPELKERFATVDPKTGQRQQFDLEKWAEEHLGRKYLEEQMSTEERERHELRRQVETYQRQEAEKQAAEAQRAQAEFDERVKQDIEREFIQALESQAVPRNQMTIQLMADIARTNLAHDIELSPEQMASEVNGQLREINRHVVGSLKGDELISYLGDDVVREIMRTSVAKVRAARGQSPVASSTPADEPAPEGRRKIESGQVVHAGYPRTSKHWWK